MKNKIKKILLSTLLIMICFGLMYVPVKADSGWDSDYDSGSWDSGSDWDSDWDSDYDYSWGSSSSSGSYSGSSGGMGVVIIAVIIIIIVFSITNNKNNRNKPSGGSRNKNIVTKSNNYQDTSVQKISSVDPNLNITEFQLKAFNIYRDLQTAWMNFDTDTIRKLTTDEGECL